MVRRASLGGGTLNPFASSGVDLGAFNVLDAGREAYIAFLKVEVAWQAGKASNDEYLAALGTYAAAQAPGTSDAISVAARLEQTKYSIERNVLAAKVDSGTSTFADLVAYDKAKLTGINVDSQEYQQRLDLYRSSQSKLINEQEQTVVDQYKAGKITTTALRAWYRGVLTGGTIDNNPDLSKSISTRITELDSRVTDEQDSRVLSDFQDGKVTTAAFLAYATAAKSRYGAGTTQAQDWQGRIDNARQNAGETGLLYRYNLSQQYADLQRFVQSNSGSRGGGVSTSTSSSKRIVLGADGQWHTIVSTKTTSHATKPSAASIAAHAKLVIEIADAKKRMAEISHKVAGVGGFVAPATVMGFYTGQLGKLAKGSADWYRVQEKIDSINQQIHQDQVYAKEGIRITYPHAPAPHAATGAGGKVVGAASAKVAAAQPHAGGQMVPHPGATGTGGGGYNLGQFMRAIATQESGGRYDARNSTTGAYGKYQILPQNWSAYAQKAGLPANAPMTPENQERVATSAFSRYAKSYHGDWAKVAAAWYAGVSGSRNEAAWAPGTHRYVNAVMSHMGTTRAGVSAGGYTPGPAGPTVVGHGATAGASVSYPSTSAPRAGTSQHGAPTAPPPPSARSGPLSIVTGAPHMAGRRTPQEVVPTRAAGFPTGLDGRAFEKFYANYEHAFESGAETFVDTSSGHAVAYFIGSDPTARIDRMRQIDDLRVRLYDQRAIAYQGTPSELTAANARNNAYKDIARHEYLILDVAEKTKGAGSVALRARTNPVASGIRVLDHTKASIEANLAQAKAAFARGDVTGAYSLLQMAQHMLDANGSDIRNMATYAEASRAAVAGIERATGGISATAALGGKGDQFTKDLERLQAFNTELKTVIESDAQAAKVLADIKSHIKLNPDGSPVVDDVASPNGKLVLSDDSFFKLKPDGSVELMSAPPALKNGVRTFGDDKTVTVKVRTGNDVIDAQADWHPGEVGSFVGQDGRTYPIQGKVVQQRINGQWVTFYENPLAPGSSSGWSATPFKIAAPGSFNSSLDANGNAVYTFQVMQGYRGANIPVGGMTYTMHFDGASGTYTLLGSSPGGPFTAAITDAFIAAAGSPNFGSLFGDAGFTRQDQGGDFGSIDQPVFGFTDQSQFDAWRNSFQPPAIRQPGYSGPAFGGLAPDDRARFGGLPPDERVSVKPGGFVTTGGFDSRITGPSSGGLAPDDRTRPITAGGFDSRVTAPTSGGLPPDERAALGASAITAGGFDRRVTGPTSGGLSPDDRAAAQAGAARTTGHPGARVAKLPPVTRPPQRGPTTAAAAAAAVPKPRSTGHPGARVALPPKRPTPRHITAI